MCHAENWRMATWDIDRGLLIGNRKSDDTAQDPLAAIRPLNALADPEGTAMLVLVNFHRFLNSPEIVQALARQITAGKQSRTFVLVLAPVVQIPVELEKLFVCLEHDLPDRAQLQEIAAGIADKPGELPEGADLSSLLDAASGLTRYEAEGAFSLSIVRHGCLAPLGDRGTQISDAQEERPVAAAPGRRTVRRPGRLGGTQRLLPHGASCCCHRQAAASRPSPRRSATRSAVPRVLPSTGEPPLASSRILIRFLTLDFRAENSIVL